MLIINRHIIFPVILINIASNKNDVACVNGSIGTQVRAAQE